MWRSEGKFSSRSSSSTLFQRGSLCSLSDWILRSLSSPISNSTSLEQGWDASCSHCTSSFDVDYWSTAPTLEPSLSYLQALIFTKLCLCHTVPGTLSTFSQKPKVICMLLESTIFLPMEESLLATCRGQNLVLKGRRFTSIIS